MLFFLLLNKQKYYIYFKQWINSFIVNLSKKRWRINIQRTQRIIMTTSIYRHINDLLILIYNYLFYNMYINYNKFIKYKKLLFKNINIYDKSNFLLLFIRFNKIKQY